MKNGRKWTNHDHKMAAMGSNGPQRNAQKTKNERTINARANEKRRHMHKQKKNLAQVPPMTTLQRIRNIDYITG
jgi:hypothetical protein